MAFDFYTDMEELKAQGIDLMPDVNRQIQATIQETGPSTDISGAVTPQQVQTQPMQSSGVDVLRDAVNNSNIDTSSLAGLGNIATQATQQIQAQKAAEQEAMQAQQPEQSAEDIMLSQGRRQELEQMQSTNKPEEFAQRLRALTGARTQSEIDTEKEQPIEGGQNSLLNGQAVVTQEFGNRSGVEKYSGGINYGTDFAVPRGTKVAAPPGEWEVVEAFNGAKVEGPRNKQGGINRGYGNSVLIQNKQTGEKMRMSHLRVGGVNVKPGQVVKGGTVLGETGASGNTAGRTGQHLDLEYYDSKGKIANVRTSPYRRFLGI